MDRTKARWGSLALVLGVLGCGPTGGAMPTGARIGSTGGTLASSDGMLTVRIPAGALAAETEITVTPIAAPVAGNLGEVYELGPTGTTFAMPVTLTLTYAQEDLASRDPAGLRVATIADGAWVALGGTRVDTAAHTVSGETMHLSPYGMIHTGATDGGTPPTDASTSEDSGTPPTDAGTGDDSGTPPTDAGTPPADGGMGTPTDSGPPPVDAGTDGGTPPTDSGTPPVDAGTDGGTPPVDAGSGGACIPAAASGPAGGPNPRCETSMPCADRPGYVLASCMNTSFGYEAMCCPSGATDAGTPPVDAGTGPMCMNEGAGGPAGGPYPRCETSMPCSRAPAGYTLTSCVNTPTGYSATCCAGSGGTDAGTPPADGGSGGGDDGGAPPVDAGGGGGPVCMADAASGPAGGPYPRCATSMPCSRFPGSVVRECRDTATGYQAMCCTP